MIKVGLTGGIGAGKSLVAFVFRQLGIEVYHADQEAKKIFLEQSVISNLISTFGKVILDGQGSVDRRKMAGIVFNNPVKLNELNDIIHPLVKSDFDLWCQDKQLLHYVIMEAAILFESGFNQYVDKTIVVTAPKETCIERVMARDNISYDDVISRMNNQWESTLRESHADYTLRNDGKAMILPQIIRLHQLLSSLS
jgi:dephospho-CoA kinase